MTTNKPKRPSHSERLQAKLLAVLKTRPGIFINDIQDALIKQGDSITDHHGHPIEDEKAARDRIAQQLRTLRDKQQVFDRQSKGVTWWYPATYRQGPKLQPTLGPQTLSAAPPPRAATPAPAPAPASTHRTYAITLEPDRAAGTAQALFRLASLLAPDIAGLLHPLVEMLNPQTEEEEQP
jgi:hypothetical protein